MHAGIHSYAQHHCKRKVTGKEKRVATALPSFWPGIHFGIFSITLTASCAKRSNISLDAAARFGHATFHRTRLDITDASVYAYYETAHDFPRNPIFHTLLRIPYIIGNELHALGFSSGELRVHVDFFIDFLPFGL